MDRHTVTKADLQETLHNLNVLLYAVEEVLNKAGRELSAMEQVKASLATLRKQLDDSELPVEIVYEAPTPAQSLLAGDPSQRLRKNVCTP
jgi:hypothetical protein